MVASRQVEISFNRRVGRQRGRWFGALAHVIGRTAITSLRKLIVPAAKRVGADCWYSLSQKLQRLLVVERISRQLQRVWEDRLWENSWVAVARKRVRAESFQQKLQNKSVGRGEIFLQTFLINHVEKFLVPTFCGSLWKSCRESPSSWRCLVVPWTRTLSHYLTRWKLHGVWISNGSKLLRWFETEVLGFETETCQGSWLRKLQYQRSKKRSTKKRQKRKRKSQRRMKQFLSLLM